MFFFLTNPLCFPRNPDWCRDGCWQRKWCRGSCLGEETKPKQRQGKPLDRPSASALLVSVPLFSTSLTLNSDLSLLLLHLAVQTQTHTPRALETGLCEVCRKCMHFLCVQTTASTTGVAKPSVCCPHAQHPLHSSSEPPSKVTLRTWEG